MESWRPLFDIFLNSPCPETEASQWLQQSFNPISSSSTFTISTSSFLSLLTKPFDSIDVASSSASACSTLNTKRFMWIQTLPNVVQARILSFLALEHRRFCAKDLRELARNILTESLEIDFWVKKTAHQLLDTVSDLNYDWISCLNMDYSEDKVDDEFGSMPDWLKDAASTNESVLPWLPILPDEFNLGMPLYGCEDNRDSSIEVEVNDQENVNQVELNRSTVPSQTDHVDS